MVEHARDVPHFGGQLAELKLHKVALSAKQVLTAGAGEAGFRPHRVPRGRRPLALAGEAVARTAGAAGPVDAAARQAPLQQTRGEDARARRRRSCAARRRHLDARALAPCRSTESRAQPARRSPAANYSDAAWYAATVPGTVLTTLIDRGVYPDYDYGLNNMAIPESLARQDYWYRTEFDAPAGIWTASNSR